MTDSKSRSPEAVVGAFVAFGFVFLGVMVFSVGSFRLFEKGRIVTIGFNHVNGLSPDAPVYVAGRHVGEVREITLHAPAATPAGARGERTPTFAVTVRAWIPAEVPLYEDMVARISSQGVLGEMYLDLEPGSQGAAIAERDFIRGRDPVPLAQIIETGNQTVEGIHEIVANFQKFSAAFSETGVAGDLRLAIGDARRTVREVEGLVVENRVALREQMSSVHAMLEENRANLGAATANLRDFSSDVRRISLGFETRMTRLADRIDTSVAAGSDTFARALDEAYLAARTAREGLEGVRSNLERTTSNVESLVAQNSDQVSAATRDLAAASATFRASAEDARKLMEEARNSDGPIGALLHDTEVVTRFRNTIENAEAASRETRSLVEEIRRDPRRFISVSVF